MVTEKRRAYNRAYRAAHHEELLAKERAYRANHVEQERARARAYRLTHREERRAYLKEYYTANKDRQREYDRSKAAERREKRRAIFEAWAPSGCAVCGWSDWRAIDAHHSEPAEKERNVRGFEYSAALQAELAKCLPLCANHHRVLHAMWADGFANKTSEELVAIMRDEEEEATA